MFYYIARSIKPCRRWATTQKEFSGILAIVEPYRLIALHLTFACNCKFMRARVQAAVPNQQGSSCVVRCVQGHALRAPDARLHPSKYNSTIEVVVVSSTVLRIGELKLNRQRKGLRVG